jgi:DNA-binding NtrC family response regulator
MLDGKKVLMVDDEEKVIKSFKFKFKERDDSKNIIALFALNAAEAKSLIESENPDLVFLDLSLGESKTPEGLEILKEYAQKFNIIVLSGYSDYSDQCMAMGAKGYLVKPMLFDKLLQEGEKVLSENQTTQKRN